MCNRQSQSLYRQSFAQDFAQSTSCVQVRGVALQVLVDLPGRTCKMLEHVGSRSLVSGVDGKLTSPDFLALKTQAKCEFVKNIEQKFNMEWWKCTFFLTGELSNR